LVFRTEEPSKIWLSSRNWWLLWLISVLISLLYNSLRKILVILETFVNINPQIFSRKFLLISETTVRRFTWNLRKNTELTNWWNTWVMILQNWTLQWSMSKMLLQMIYSSLLTLVLTTWQRNNSSNQELSSSLIFARTFWIPWGQTVSSFHSIMIPLERCSLSARNTSARENTEEFLRLFILISTKSLRWIRLENKTARSLIQLNSMKMSSLLKS